MIAQRFEAIKNNILHPELKLLMQGFANAEETFSTYQGKQDYDNHMVLLARSYPDDNSIEVITFMSSGKPTKKTNVKKVKLIGITTKSTNQAVVEEDCPDCPKGETVARGKVPAIDIINVKKVTDENPFVEKEESIVETNGETEGSGSELEVIKVSKKQLGDDRKVQEDSQDAPQDEVQGDSQDEVQDDSQDGTKVVQGEGISAAKLIHDGADLIQENQPEEEEKEEPVLNPDSPQSIRKFFGTKTKLTAYARSQGITVSNKLTVDEITTKIYDFLK